jgi:hypothetical protein
MVLLGYISYAEAITLVVVQDFERDPNADVLADESFLQGPLSDTMLIESEDWRVSSDL